MGKKSKRKSSYVKVTMGRKSVKSKALLQPPPNSQQQQQQQQQRGGGGDNGSSGRSLDDNSSDVSSPRQQQGQQLYYFRTTLAAPDISAALTLRLYEVSRYVRNEPKSPSLPPSLRTAIHVYLTYLPIPSCTASAARSSGARTFL